MKQEAGKKKVVLELGGNAGAAVTESANIDFAVQRCLIGGFAYSGQVCIHLQRILIHTSIFNEFKDTFTEGARNLKEGPPTDINTDITAMIDEENALRVEDWIKKAVEEGAELLCGGKRRGSYVEPTILTNTKHDMLVNASEVFGPVVTIEPYTNFTEAIDSINDSIYGLQAGVFTNNLDEVNYAFNNLDVGGVIINDIPTFRVDHMPYGGVKDSGFGREGLKYSIIEMLEPKLMLKEYLSDGLKKDVWTSVIKSMRVNETKNAVARP